MDRSPQEEEEEETSMLLFGQRRKCVLSFTALLVLGIMFGTISPRRRGGMHIRTKTSVVENTTKSTPFPQELLDESVYSSSDFVNQEGISPVFWTPDITKKLTTSSTWGPCYPPTNENNWTQLVRISQKKGPKYPTKPKHPDMYASNPEPNLAGYCRPGFIIIGAGKCGTSSLYHYITGHPRVLPASMKQIHYFKVRLHHDVLCWHVSLFFPTI